ncbi:hypothetical protein MCOR02_004473 [Pyricularia oryzae]|uniref:F-box domain-containing protein n=3 Tax=Pyricularia TaxID=48558 RepID=A0ABQ8NAT9_PYRGI|nr:hypothetical protein OOU_Y34scaffold00774g2 [Pyricularia oryzae Y34]KAH8842312.1 hypothetical protein MCOR01_006227 [Pyricularia oryzae]KAI6293663.1 hypothetical protein MCOR33_008954 [Pyricularia grisea]KAH9435549.1 hypothetical protein MCOR02_004473 [Pyricularia oryzae]KAI6254206.1 hypothetical protein MCOR19_009292 [Pyricularia oryzae]
MAATLASSGMESISNKPHRETDIIEAISVPNQIKYLEPLEMQNKSRRKRVRQSIDQLPPEGSLTSPLLRLPAELRLRIYELLLDVGQISIDYRAWSPNTNARPGFYCRTLASDADPWALPPVHHTVRGTSWGPARRGHGASGSRVTDKDAKTGATSGGVTLLSGVCRQLYHETAILPFQLNTWSFHNPRLMNRYLKERRMTLKQRRAVKVLFLREKPSKAVQNLFGGLQVVAWRNEGQGRLVRRTFDK